VERGPFLVSLGGNYMKRFESKLTVATTFALLAVLFLPGLTFAQLKDPGVRTGDINGQKGLTITTPAPLSSVNTSDGSLQFFVNAQGRFTDQEVVNNTTSNNVGLGPRFNFNSCSGCHIQPAVGGTGPAVNPQFTAIANGIAGSTNTTPTFITMNGPTREARFPFFLSRSPNTHERGGERGGSDRQLSPNGGVEDLFTVSGRADVPQGRCTNLPQPDFAAAEAANNIIFRIPTPLFGAGLIENLDDSTLLANQAAQAGNIFGISGAFNRNGNDGTISRFGWKAQNKSLLLFAGEANNVEKGIANEIFPQDRPLPEEELSTGLPPDCLNLSGFGYPEDTTNFMSTPDPANDPFATSASVPADIVMYAIFMRFLAPPIPVIPTDATAAASVANGQALFTSVGCASCHTPAILSTQTSSFTTSLGGAPVNLFSDLEIHHMGVRLADNVSQGGAGGDQFRTAPLWGLGQRIFLLHDGRTTDLLQAIEAHASRGSESTQVEQNFDVLTPSQKQDLLNFLRSL
jgi:CxxC motif-containing protein (DUF1111 family)